MPEIKCGDCGKAMELIDGKYGWQYRCTNYPWCRGIVGCHQKTKEPLGIPVNAATRIARIKAHDAFDDLWQKGNITRAQAYRYMAGEIGIQHIGECSLEQCETIIEWCKHRSENNER
jgi:ssDNA-binding Zn-finger/Zn-ribbon topoisomerase 1